MKEAIMNNDLTIGGFIILILVFSFFVYIENLMRKSKTTIKRIKKVYKESKKDANRKRINKIGDNIEIDKNNTIVPEKMFSRRSYRRGFTGVYIIYNKTKSLFCVGKAEDVYERCKNHFIGKGNSDVYADYKYGDEFTIDFVPLINSGFNNIDELESYFIDKFNVAVFGYRKNRK